MKLPRAIAILVSALGLGTALGGHIDFKKEYSAFGDAPAANVRAIAEKLVAVSLKDFELEAENVIDAHALINEALQDNDVPFGLSLIMEDSDNANYESPITIPKGTRSLGEVINLLCEQADLQWDFSAAKLTFKPNKAESGRNGD